MRSLRQDREGGSGRGGGFGERNVNLEEAVVAALELMNRLGVTMAILAPPPFPPDRRESYGVTQLQVMVREHPDRFAFSAGGESMNPLTQGVAANNMTPELLARFTGEAQAIAAAGAAAFGELAAEHFSFARINPNHPYESHLPTIRCF